MRFQSRGVNLKLKEEMKKLLLIAAAALVLSSCYNTRIIVGNVMPNEPLVKVSTEWNHHLIYGLVPLDNSTMQAEDYTAPYENYVVRTYMSFLNGLVSGLTWGLYTPTQTSYYVPWREIGGAVPSEDSYEEDILEILE